MNATSTVSCIVQDVIPDRDAIRIRWADDHVSVFHYIWLVDNAPEFRNGSGHRIHDTSRIPLTIRPRFIHSHPNNVLEFGWEAFPHTTCFSTVWLREHCYSQRAYPSQVKDGSAQNRPSSKLWNGTVGATFFSRSFREVLDSQHGVMEAWTQWQKYGLIIFRNMPSTLKERQLGFDRLANVAREKLETIWIGLAQSMEHASLESDDREIRAHTVKPYDQPLPAGGGLHGNSSQGRERGFSFIDGLLAAELLRTSNPVGFSFLSSMPVTFGMQNGGRPVSTNRSVIQVDEHNLVTGVCFHNGAVAPFSIAPDRMVDFYHAYQTFGGLLINPHYQLHVTLENDETVLFDNTRVLFGRNDLKMVKEGSPDKEGTAESARCVSDLQELGAYELCVS